MGYFFAFLGNDIVFTWGKRIFKFALLHHLDAQAAVNFDLFPITNKYLLYCRYVSYILLLLF